MFLKNKNIIFKIRRSKVTDYAALSLGRSYWSPINILKQNIFFFKFKNLYPVTNQNQNYLAEMVTR